MSTNSVFNDPDIPINMYNELQAVYKDKAEERLIEYLCLIKIEKAHNLCNNILKRTDSFVFTIDLGIDYYKGLLNKFEKNLYNMAEITEVYRVCNGLYKAIDRGIQKNKDAGYTELENDAKGKFQEYIDLPYLTEDVKNKIMNCKNDIDARIKWRNDYINDLKQQIVDKLGLILLICKPPQPEKRISVTIPGEIDELTSEITVVNDKINKLHSDFTTTINREIDKSDLPELESNIRDIKSKIDAISKNDIEQIKTKFKDLESIVDRLSTEYKYIMDDLDGGKDVYLKKPILIDNPRQYIDGLDVCIKQFQEQLKSIDLNQWKTKIDEINNSSSVFKVKTSMWYKIVMSNEFILFVIVLVIVYAIYSYSRDKVDKIDDN